MISSYGVLEPLPLLVTPATALRRFVRVAFIAAGTALTAACSRSSADSAPLTVYAASDLALALEELVPTFERATGVQVRTVLGSTGNLARQIEQGAPADVFFAANVAYVDQLRGKELIIPESQRLYARGRIVLAASAKSAIPVRALRDLLKPEVRKVAIANPDHAPYGIAAREALQAAGLWDTLRPKLVLGENIRQALQYVESGAADAGIVALSLARTPGIVTAHIDESLHRPINQAAAVIRESRQPHRAAEFIRFVVGPEGRAVMTRFGFAMPNTSDATARPRPTPTP
jgi:molybdate transport system substrate-binding protein